MIKASCDSQVVSVTLKIEDTNKNKNKKKMGANSLNQFVDDRSVVNYRHTDYGGARSAAPRKDRKLVGNGKIGKGEGKNEESG